MLINEFLPCDSRLLKIWRSYAANPVASQNKRLDMRTAYPSRIGIWDFRPLSSSAVPLCRLLLPIYLVSIDVLVRDTVTSTSTGAQSCNKRYVSCTMQI